VKAGTVRVILVDDQASFRSVARLVIDMADGFELVGEAESAEEGLELTSVLAPDLVLMDINLPGIDGLEATRRLADGYDNVRVVVLSTYEAAEYETRSLEAGAVAFISKEDFGPGTLAAVWAGVS
jgi:two-component system invasion response regulator UvrY